MANSAKESSNPLVEYLASVEGLGPRSLRQIVAALGTWKNFLSLDSTQIADRFAFLAPKARSTLVEARSRAESFRACGYYISCFDAEYPERLAALYDPPSGFYYRGKLEIICSKDPWIAVVGTRRASPYALNHCAQLIARMKVFAPVIVSGLALGIDGMAHRAALANDLKTVAVLGSSVETIYPSRHRDLARALLKDGLLISELPAGIAVAAWHFPKRNRIIAALADAVVVVEAPEKSGALLTADFALDLGKEIYVVPGPADGERNRGGHRLIQQGAKLLVDPEEIFRDLGLPISPLSPEKVVSKAEVSLPLFPETARPPLGDMERKLLEIIGFTASHIDKITDMSHLPSPRVTGLLVQMSLKGLVVSLPGGFFELGTFGREWLSKTE